MGWGRERTVLHILPLHKQESNNKKRAGKIIDHKSRVLRNCYN